MRHIEFRQNKFAGEDFSSGLRFHCSVDGRRTLQVPDEFTAVIGCIQVSTPGFALDILTGDMDACSRNLCVRSISDKVPFRTLMDNRLLYHGAFP